MKSSMIGIVYSVAFALVSTVGFVRAEDSSPISGAASVGLFSDYMFRGFKNYDGTSIQPQVSLTYDTGNYGSLSGGVWAHVSAENKQSADKLTEVDYNLTYAFQLEETTLKLGHIWYTYPSDRNGAFIDSKEIFASIVLDDSAINPLGALNPSLTVYHDYDFLSGGQYYELGFSHLFECGTGNKAWNITPFVTFGFTSNSEKIYNDNGLVQTTVGASTTIPWGELTLTPSVSYTAEADKNTVNELWFGTTVGWSS